MLPEPLHPAVVHLPMALAVLLPFFSILALWAIHKGVGTRTAWGVPVLLALLLSGSAWTALRTGEAEEERVESVVAGSAIHEHEEAAERFVLFGGVVTLLAIGGLARGSLGSASRILTTVGAVVGLGAGIQVGARGGELVYEHGAALAYAGDPSPDSPSDSSRDESEHRDER